MADIKTHLRELSVAVSIGILKNRINVDYNYLLDSRNFYEIASSVIDNDISSAQNLLLVDFNNPEYRQILDNGLRLGETIYNSSEFDFKLSDTIIWQGNDTQKGDPIDLVVGEFAFSLKEESFILKNMGLYTLLNNLTASNYSRGIHVFSLFAPREYDEWFKYTWNLFINYLINNGEWVLQSDGDVSTAFIEGNNIILSYNNLSSIVPVEISTNEEYMLYTNSKTREKVFSKWIKNVAIYDSEYKRIKGICSYVAGQNLSNKINAEFNPRNVYQFLQIYPFTYYYAKTTHNETTILRVPSQSEYEDYIEFIGCEFKGDDQLNVITTFRNKITNQIIQFRNECRFSHGQFNGTPEAKMYVVRDTPLTILYIPIKY
jgi:hypothetical protein